MIKMKSPVIIIQARTGSKRLPNKMLMPFFKDTCILEILVERILNSKIVPKELLIIATTNAEHDDRIVELAHKIRVQSFRGSENNVLDRFIKAAKQYRADKIIRICADNVFLDMNSLNILYHTFSISNNDYLSFVTSNGIPSIKTHFGFWAEAVTLNALERVAKMTDERIFHEHVTNFIYNHLDVFSCKFIPISDVIPGIEELHDLRLTVDTEDDFRIQQEIYSNLIKNGDNISPDNIIRFLSSRDDLYSIMKKNILNNSK